MRKTYKIVENNKYWLDVNSLAEAIRAEKWLDPSTLFICIDPVNTSPSSNILSHKLSSANKNEVYEEIPVRIPSLIQSQVFDEQDQQYVTFESHLYMFTKRAIYTSQKYLAIISHICPDNEKYVQRICQVINNRIDTSQFKIATLYLHENSSFKPDFYVDRYKGKLIYEWQNSNNPALHSIPARNGGRNVEE